MSQFAWHVSPLSEVISLYCENENQNVCYENLGKHSLKIDAVVLWKVLALNDSRSKKYNLFNLATLTLQNVCVKVFEVGGCVQNIYCVCSRKCDTIV